MTKDEVLKLALAALEAWLPTWPNLIKKQKTAITAIKQALAAPVQEPVKVWCETCEGTGAVYQEHQKGCWVGGEYSCPDCDGNGYYTTPPAAPVQEPWNPTDTAYRPGGLPQDFIKHEVENEGDWSEWVNPNPEQYFMKCCDCGLVHEMQFKVAKYSEGDECEFVADSNLQAVFRARRATLPEAPVQEPVACVQDLDEVKRKHLVYEKGMDWKDPLYTTPPAQPATVQVSPLEFVTMVMEKEHLVGKPLFWAEWPNKEKNT